MVPGAPAKEQYLALVLLKNSMHTPGGAPGFLPFERQYGGLRPQYRDKEGGVRAYLAI